MRVLEPRQRPMLAPPERADLEDDRPVGQLGLRRQVDRSLGPSSQHGQQAKTGQLAPHAGGGRSKAARSPEAPPDGPARSPRERVHRRPSPGPRRRQPESLSRRSARRSIAFHSATASLKKVSGGGLNPGTSPPADFSRPFSRRNGRRAHRFMGRALNRSRSDDEAFWRGGQDKRISRPPPRERSTYASESS